MNTPLTQLKLYEKYDVPAPRYTSYPTVPYWEEKPSPVNWIEDIKRAIEKNPLWSLYIHIPFCENRCSYCGCNTIITKNHKTEEGYIALVEKEWQLYLKKVPTLATSQLFEIHLGGGTPNFLSPSNLDALLNKILSLIQNSSKPIGSMEIDPRHCTLGHLEVLKKHNFNRISLGVQDFNIEVQKLINRFQSFEQTKEIVDLARVLDFTSVNFDLIYGLPNQNLEKIKKTIEQTIILKPDRIALYSLAIIPWLKPSQKLFKDSDLPKPQEKRELYDYSRDTLLEAGYLEVGMDHFALPNESLALSLKNKHLHRNFMGYTHGRTDFLLGLGVSAISETPDSFHQNFKEIEAYTKALENLNIPSFRGHCLTNEDKQQRELILEFMTKGEVQLKLEEYRRDVKTYLEEMFKDELVELNEDKLRITEKGRPFLRNACMALDARMRARHGNQKVSQVFSKAV